MGLARVERLVESRAVRPRWHPFQLRPDTPEGGVPITTVYPKEFLDAGHARLKVAAAEAGLPFVPPEHLVNTHLAHEAAEFAEEQGRGHAFHSAVLRANFGEGRDIGNVDVLVDLGKSVGLDGDALRAVLTDRRYRSRVDQAIAKGQGLGVSSVPTFVLANGHGLAGAQPLEVFEQALAAPPSDRADALMAVLEDI